MAAGIFDKGGAAFNPVSVIQIEHVADHADFGMVDMAAHHAIDAAAGLMMESVEQQKLIGSPNQLEAIMSNLQKRAANYKD